MSDNMEMARLRAIVETLAAERDEARARVAELEELIRRPYYWHEHAPELESYEGMTAEEAAIEYAEYSDTAGNFVLPLCRAVRLPTLYAAIRRWEVKGGGDMEYGVTIHGSNAEAKASLEEAAK
jgi:hypothetical protein